MLIIWRYNKSTMGKNVFKSRLKNAKRNVYSGLMKQLVNILLTFIVRTTILYVLGAEYQGINGLFSSILQMLNLSELGFSAAVTFILYKPIAENDNKTICAILEYLRKIYYILGFVILGLGIAFIPFLPKLISGSYPNDINVYVLFCLYLVNSVVSYWLFAYKNTLLYAMQREDIISKVFTLTSFVTKILQIVLLLIFHNYYFYVLLLPICSIANNILIQIFAKKYFPEIVPSGKVSQEIKREFGKQVKAAMLNRISDIARNSLDNIVLSSFLGLVSVAIYDNYYYIYAAVYGVMGIIIHAIQASIGNSLVIESVDKNYKDLKIFNFMFMWVVGWCTICLAALYQPFMHIWMRGNEELLLSNPNMLLFCLYFYVISMCYTKNVYLEAKGLYWECRFIYIIEAILNLALNLVLGYFWGITGVIVATIITIIFVNFIGGSKILFKYYFKRKCTQFLGWHMIYFLVTIASGIITLLICSLIRINGFGGLAVKLLVCIVCPNIVYLLVYIKFKQFDEAKEIIKRMLKKRG